VRCHVDALPFADGAVDALRANHVLEHQSYELIDRTLAEWARVMRPGSRLDIGVPDAKFVAAQWVNGEIDTAEANYWILGGHSDRVAHQGVDERGVPRWIWNAHHTLFDAESLGAAVAAAGFVELRIFSYEVRNLRCYATKPA
jgi:predicted SAM-dependent methyltransferase